MCNTWTHTVLPVGWSGGVRLSTDIINYYQPEAEVLITMVFYKCKWGFNWILSQASKGFDVLVVKIWWPRRVMPQRPGPKLKSQRGPSKAEAAFCWPLRLITKPTRPFVGRCGLLQSRRGLLWAAAAYYKADAAHAKPKRPGKKPLGLTISQSGLLELLYRLQHSFLLSTISTDFGRVPLWCTTWHENVPL